MEISLGNSAVKVNLVLVKENEMIARLMVAENQPFYGRVLKAVKNEVGRDRGIYLAKVAKEKLASL